MDNDQVGYVQVDTAMVLIVDPCQLKGLDPQVVAELVQHGKAALLAVQMDGVYTLTVDAEAVGVVLDVDPETSSFYSGDEVLGALT